LQIVGATNTQSNVAVALPGSFPYIRPNGGNLKEGDNIYIFGYPGASNLVFNVNKGIVSSFTTDGTYINTDALIDHGNSGGAAITSDGRFVGIPSAKYVGTDNDYLGEILKVENLNVPTN
jgi:S1-C subfamily serine protease